MSTLDSLKKISSHPLAEFIVFDEAQKELFLTHAVPLLNSGYSIGCISSSIAKALDVNLKPTEIEDVYTLAYPVDAPSILCFSSGTKNNQKGIIRTYTSWKESFAIIMKHIGVDERLRGVVIGALPYSLSLFGVMESLFREKKPLLFPTQDLRYFRNLNTL